MGYNKIRGEQALKPLIEGLHAREGRNTNAAREDYSKKGYEVVYINVKASPEKMGEMLKWSKGSRQVPVIIEGGMAALGFGGTLGV